MPGRTTILPRFAASFTCRLCPARADAAVGQYHRAGAAGFEAANAPVSASASNVGTATVLTARRTLHSYHTHGGAGSAGAPQRLRVIRWDSGDRRSLGEFRFRPSSAGGGDFTEAAPLAARRPCAPTPRLEPTTARTDAEGAAAAQLLDQCFELRGLEGENEVCWLKDLQRSNSA
jgi:hypothetical protein